MNLGICTRALLLAVTSLLLTASAACAWQRVPTTINDAFAMGGNFDSISYGGFVYTASTGGDALASLLRVTRSPLGGSQEADYVQLPPDSDPATDDEIAYNSPRFVTRQGQLCLVAARRAASGVPAYTLTHFCRDGSGWTADDTFDSPLTSLASGAQADFKVIGANTPYLIYRSRAGNSTSVKAATFGASGWSGATDVAPSSTDPAVQFAVADVGGTPYVAVQYRDGLTYGPVTLRKFTSGTWQQEGPELAAPAGRTIVAFDVAGVGGVATIAWAEGNADETAPWLSRDDDALHVSYVNNGAWQNVGGELNGPGSQVSSVGLRAVGSRALVAWGDGVPGDTGVAGRIRAALGPSALAANSIWSDITDGPSVVSEPDAQAFDVQLVDFGGRPAIAEVFRGPSAQSPVTVLTGDVPPAEGAGAGGAGGGGSGESVGGPPPVTPPVTSPTVKPKSKPRRRRVCRRSKRTHKVVCKYVKVKTRKKRHAAVPRAMGDSQLLR